MTLSELTTGIPGVQLAAETNPEITGLTYDSRQVSPGDLFFALPGAKTNGVEFAAEAAQKGAAAVLTQRELPLVPCPVILAQNAREAMARIASRFYGEPSRQLKVAGVTGTNGKTTTAYLIKHLCDRAALRCGLIGTIHYAVGDEILPAARTTPESADIQKMFAGMRAAGGRACAMEVSSHALVQHRADAIQFTAAVFTNLTQDHLDYHETMDAYYAAKAHLFELLQAGGSKKAKAVINADDRFGHRLLEQFGGKLPIVTYGLGATAQFRASNVKMDAHGATYRLEAKGREYLVRLPLIGMFNVYNSLAALAAANALGVELRAAVAALAQAPQVPGRLERVPAKRSFQVFVDYAHTDDALRNVLRTLKDLKPARLITVFGCGGDRDKTKRPKMAAAAEEYSDYVVATSDNPRGEDPQAILADIRKGLKATWNECIEDREAAIRRAVELAGPGDIVLIAGKGHENYQEFANGRRIPFDDASVAGRAIHGKAVQS
ncbi:MAG TPA: UDP-N-acetylmuramoyl-L-alanyl-D-glutamate--2,6-diaminopimelate ligase [Chthoniobacterales bacterium]